MKWPEFAKVVFNQTFSEDDADNCAAGRMGVLRCVALHKWMRDNERDVAARLDVALGVTGFPKAEVWLTSRRRTPDGGSETTHTLLKTIIYEPDGQRVIYGDGKPSERPEPKGKFYDIQEEYLSARVYSLDDEPEGS